MDKGQPCAVEVVANTAAARAEIECMQAVAGHPGVVRLFKYYAGNLDAGMMLLILEYCNHGSLLGKRFSGATLFTATRQLMTGIGHVHAMGFIHRDIKQDNILVCSNSSGNHFDLNTFPLKLADFGCAAKVEQCIAPAGTRRLMAPELLLLCEAPCPKSDMWSAGYVL